MVQKVHFSGQFSYRRDLSGNTNTLRPAGLHQPDWAGFPQPDQVHVPEPSAIHGPPPQGPHQSPCGSCLQPQIQANSSHWGFRVQGGQETVAFPFRGIPADRAVLRQGGGLNVWTPWVSGHSSSWILGISAWRQQEAETPPGLLADPHHRPRLRRDNKRNSKWYRRPLGSLRQAEEPCRDTAWASSIWAFFPWKIKRNPAPERQEGKDLGAGTALPLILACNPHYLLVSASHFR